MGRTNVVPGTEGMVEVTERNGVSSDGLDGARSDDGRVMGTYFHGFFDEPGVKSWFLRQLDGRYQPAIGSTGSGEDVFDRLAAHFEESLDLGALFRIAGIDAPVR
jgi:adenosylcobyric acid synthase